VEESFVSKVSGSKARYFTKIELLNRYFERFSPQKSEHLSYRTSPGEFFPI